MAAKSMLAATRHAKAIRECKTSHAVSVRSLAILADGDLDQKQRTRLLSLAWSRRRSIRAKENAAQRA